MIWPPRPTVSVQTTFAPFRINLLTAHSRCSESCTSTGPRSKTQLRLAGVRARVRNQILGGVRHESKLSESVVAIAANSGSSVSSAFAFIHPQLQRFKLRANQRRSEHIPGDPASRRFPRRFSTGSVTFDHRYPAIAATLSRIGIGTLPRADSGTAVNSTIAAGPFPVRCTKSWRE